MANEFNSGLKDIKEGMESKTKLRERAAIINEWLAKTYPDSKCSLNFDSPFQLLAATILSAQCTDERVNIVTPALFKKYPDAKSLAKAPIEKIEDLVRTTGFYHNKAKSLKGMAEALVANHKGNVPGTMEELQLLPGVGRKTANVVLGNCFDTPGVTVDTHMIRVSRRLGLTRQTDQHKIEKDIMAVIPQSEWSHFSHRIIFHGRAICQARKPKCEECGIAHLCPYFAKSTKP
jgi:endonuclease-3